MYVITLEVTSFIPVPNKNPRNEPKADLRAALESLPIDNSPINAPVKGPTIIPIGPKNIPIINPNVAPH